MKFNALDWRLRWYRVLTLVICGLMLASFILPWWSVSISVVPGNDPVRIYGYGLRHNLVEQRSYITADETPPYQTVLAWVYLVASIGLVLYSTVLKGRGGQWLLGGIGFTYIAYVTVAIFIVVANRLSDFGISLLGMSTAISYETMDVAIGYSASLCFGYYLACTAGGICIALALLRNVIIGRSKSGAEEVG